MKKSMAKRKKKKRRPRRLYILLFLVIIIILSTTFMIFNKREPGENVKKDVWIQKEIEIQASEKKESIPQAQTSPPLLKEVNYTIKKGTTFADILSGHQITPSEIHKMREVAKTTYDLAKIKAGHELRVFSTNNGNVQRIEYDIDETDYLLLEKVKEKDGYNAEIKKIPYKIELRVISGTLEDNLIAAVNKQEEEAALALSLSDIFAWDIDFYTDPRTGDKFKIMFEKRSLRDEFVGYGKIIAAEYINQGQKFQAFHYTYPDTKEGDHFDAEGNSIRKEFLKSPIPFSRIRITSGFSYRRFHPIRKVYRPHYGVDYAARVGTQIQATADGTVTFAGWNKASGYTIKISHKNYYETMYLHLHSSKRAAGIRKGAKVKQGQIIGYVGSSGESTGPHLDYRIKYRGSYINPLAKKFRPVSPLRKEFLEDYKGKVALYSIFLENPLALVTWFSDFFTLPPSLLESFLD